MGISKPLKNSKITKQNTLNDMNKNLENLLDELLENKDNLPNFEERKEILVHLLGFTCSDLDNYQFYKKVDGNKNYFYLTLDDKGWKGEYINPDNFSHEQKESAISNWGYDVKFFNEEYLNIENKNNFLSEDEDYNQMLCEAIYENEFESGYTNLAPDLLAMGENINFNLSNKQKDIIKGVTIDILKLGLDNSNEIIKKEIIEKGDFERLINEVKETLIQDIKDNGANIGGSILMYLENKNTNLNDIIEEVGGYLKSIKPFLPVFGYEYKKQ